MPLLHCCLRSGHGENESSQGRSSLCREDEVGLCESNLGIILSSKLLKGGYDIGDYTGNYCRGY